MLTRTLEPYNKGDYLANDAFLAQALKENTIGTINYRLTIDGKTETYQTSIIIGPPNYDESFEEFSIPSTAILVVICLVLVIGYIISNQIRHKRR